MSKNSSPAPERKPSIHLSSGDYDMIAGLALGMQSRSPELSELILSEIDRATVHPDGQLPPDIVGIGSEVTFLDNSNGTTRTVTLVVPGEADIEAGRVSVMTPVGAGLIGMGVGREISWPHTDGRPRMLKILSVEQNP